MNQFEEAYRYALGKNPERSCLWGLFRLFLCGVIFGAAIVGLVWWLW